MNEFAENPLYQIMHPKSIAFWGASNNPMGMGSVQLEQVLSLGFEGKVFPMHPRETEVMGLKAYMHAKDLPVVPDLAIFVLPTVVVPDILEECGKAGIKRAIIVSAGFGEMGSEGRELQDRLVEIARKYDIIFLGPNCIGAVNPHWKLNTTFCSYDAPPGFIGIASQSGSFVTQMFVHLEKFGIGFSQGFSVGNEAVVDITDCIEYLAKCPDTKVISLYIEAIRRGREFFRIAREVSKVKPIVAFLRRRVGIRKEGRIVAYRRHGWAGCALRRHFQASWHHTGLVSRGDVRPVHSPGESTFAEGQQNRRPDPFRRAGGCGGGRSGEERPEACPVFRRNG